MSISYNLPSANIIKDFSKPEKFNDWLPGLFKKSFYNGIFPINTKEDTIDENTVFSKSISSPTDFDISLKRYFLFLYCLKSQPYIFQSASKIINYKNDENLFRPELADFLSKIQTNEIKNKINSSLTIDLVKKYAVDKSLDINTEQLSNFFEVANSEDFKNAVSRKLNIVLYESVIKHTLYNNLRYAYNLTYKEDISSNWMNQAAALEAGEFSYYIDIEGGPDNKSFPVVCVLTKRINGTEQEAVTEQTNKFLSNIFGRSVTNDCLANIIGEPDQFENNYKRIPILKGKNNKSFYNAICVVYDFSKILLSEKKTRDTKAQSIAEASLGYFSKYTVEIKDINDLQERKQVLTNIFDKYFSDDSFSTTKYQIANIKRHKLEVYSRINIVSQDEIENSLSSKIKINLNSLKSSYLIYVDSLISKYKKVRSTSVRFSQYSDKDENVLLHFDGALNLLAISAIPKVKENEIKISFYSPFDFTDNQNNITFNLLVENEPYLSDKFFGSYSESPNGNFSGYEKQIKSFAGYRVCFMTKTLERLIFNNFSSYYNNNYVTFKDLNSDAITPKIVDISTKLYETFGEVIQRQDYFTDEGKFIDKSIEIIGLTTDYTETKYQSISLQTLAFYLINCYEGNKIFINSGDIKIFGEQFHYPVLSVLPATESDNIDLNLNLNLEDINKILQEVLIVEQKVQKIFAIAKGIVNFSPKKEINSIILSNSACFSDVIMILEDFVEGLVNIVPGSSIGSADYIDQINFEFIADINKQIVTPLKKIWNRLPLFQMIIHAIEDIINQLLKLQIEKDPCKPAPKPLGLNIGQIGTGIEYLKTIYENALREFSDIFTLIKAIPKLPKFGKFKFFIAIILNITLKLIIGIIFAIITGKLKDHMKKICQWSPSLVDLLNLPEEQVLKFAANDVPDSFGNISESGGVLYSPEHYIDLNVLIDLSEIQSREYVHNKFADEFSLPKTTEGIDEIQNFLSQISPALDLNELSAMLRGFGSDYTIQTVADAISLLQISFKQIFSDQDGVIKLFVFLSKYCDYNVCEKQLANSIQKFEGNICSPQPSKRKKYEDLLKEIGEDPAKIIRDQIYALEKDLDNLCSLEFEDVRDVLKNGPNLLPKSLHQYMVLPFKSIVNYQKSIYTFELGLGLDGIPFSAAQKKILGLSLYNPSPDEDGNPVPSIDGIPTQRARVVGSIFNNFSNNLKQIKIETPKIGGLSISIDPNGKNFLGTTYYDFVKLSNVTKDSLSGEISKRQQYFKDKGIIVSDDIIYQDLINKKYANVYRSSYLLFNKLNSSKSFENLYKNIVYCADIASGEVGDDSFLDKLVTGIQEKLESANNYDLVEEPESYLSYINKIKDIYNTSKN